MTEQTSSQPIAISELPAIGQPLRGSTFAGIATVDGQHVAVVLLADRLTSGNIGWKRATAWVKTVGGVLPSPQVAALLHHAAGISKPRMCWTSETIDSMTAVRIDFSTGAQDFVGTMSNNCAIAVCLMPLAGNAAADDLERRVAAVEARVVAEDLTRRIAALEARQTASA